MLARDRYRLHALDGAVLAFQPSTGTSIRLETDATVDVRRAAPRVVLFSLSHACNLRCGFCSRDATQKARWSTDAAFETLRSLWLAGTLEVSFGGGEPLLHAGFIELLERLHRETTLALHFTTNGTRVTPALASRIAPLVGEIRLSVYEGHGWEAALSTLTEAGCRVGVNVMPTPSSLGALPRTLSVARDRGACDVAALRYVGNDPSSHLGPAPRSMLEQALVASPLPVRVSNCLLDALPNLPRLTPGLTVATPAGLAQDCGAGRDFVVLDPDAGVRSCSFHADRVPLESVPTWLARYRVAGRRVASARRGCARPVSLTRPTERGAFVYRAFASNNSGDTLLVARFEGVEDAKAFVRDLFGPEAPDADGGCLEWPRDAEASTHRWQDDDRVARVGRTLLASGYHSDDALPELRALLWDAGAMPVYSAIHAHHSPRLVVGVREPSTADIQQLSDLGFEASRRGPLLLGHGGSEAWWEALSVLGAKLEGRAWSAELLEPRDGERWVDVMKHLDAEPWGPSGYLYVRFPEPERAALVVESLDAQSSRAGDTVLCDVTRFRPRLGRYVTREGGCAWWIPRGPLLLRLWSYTWSRARGRPLDLAAFEAAADGEVEVSLHRTGVHAHAKTTDPHVTMRAMQRVFSVLKDRFGDAKGGVWVGPQQPMLMASRRVKNELVVLP